MSAFVSLRNSSCYWPSLNHLAKSLRGPMITAATTTHHVQMAANDQKLGAFASMNPFPLPGDVAVAMPYSNNTMSTPVQNQMLTEAPVEQKQDLVAQMESLKGHEGMDVEVSAVNCPETTRREVEALFPNKTVPWPLNAVTISQHTTNDMSVWSTALAEERQVLAAQFIATATAVCSELKAAGYFADFIDPTCGRTFLSRDSASTTLYETDNLQKSFGVEVKELGCCRVVLHPLWGTKAYNGTLFTNAPVDSPIIKRLLTPSE